jgi:hypothetical protein
MSGQLSATAIPPAAADEIEYVVTVPIDYPIGVIREHPQRETRGWSLWAPHAYLGAFEGFSAAERAIFDAYCLGMFGEYPRHGSCDRECRSVQIRTGPRGQPRAG